VPWAAAWIGFREWWRDVGYLDGWFGGIVANAVEVEGKGRNQGESEQKCDRPVVVEYERVIVAVPFLALRLCRRLRCDGG